MQSSPSCANRRSANGNRLTAGRRKDGRRVSAKWFIRFTLILGVFFISTVYLAVKGQSAFTENDLQGASKYSSGRSLLSAGGGGHGPGHGNSSKNVPVYETCDFENAHVPYGFVVLYAILVLIFFISLAIICDDFFVPSLEVISEELNLSEDVAGATFMAAGSSAPELFTSIAGVAFDSDVGVGTIVGSAVFNINIIIALTAALAGQVLVLDPRPLIRDSFFYALSIACFIGFAWDGKFVLYEAIIMLILYFLYIVIMKFNTQIMNMACCKRGTVQPVLLDEEGSVEGSGSAAENQKMKESSSTLGSFSNVGPPPASKLPPIPSGAQVQRKESLGVPGAADPNQKHVFHHVKHGELSHHFTPHHHHHDHEHGVWYLFVVKPHPTVVKKQDGEHADEGKHDGDGKEEDEEEDEPTLKPCPCLPAINMYYPDKEVLQESLGCLKFTLKWIFFIISFPFVCAFTWTIPNCGEPKLRKYYVVSFCLSVLWIAAISFAMVTLVIRAGCILNVDHYTMGLVIVAVGTSVPDALSSILVARDGFGDMAVSNALGSNVFDIDLGLGLPFVISIAIKGGAPMILLSDTEMQMWEDGNMVLTPHAKFGFILLLILVFTLVIFCAVRFRLNKIVGITFVFMYVLFLIYAFVQEFACNYDC